MEERGGGKEVEEERGRKIGRGREKGRQREEEGGREGGRRRDGEEERGMVVVAVVEESVQSQSSFCFL